jgi:hypothetical protein
MNRWRLPRCRSRDLGKRRLRDVGGLRWSDQLADGILADAQRVRDRPVTHSPALQHLNCTQTLSGDPSSTATRTLLSAERRHPALCIARLVPAHGSHRSAKHSRHVSLLSEALLHQKHHRIDLGDRVVGAIAMHGKSGNDGRALIRFDPQAAARIDHHRTRRRR